MARRPTGSPRSTTSCGPSPATCSAERRRRRGVDWKLLAESGWLGLEVPEALDGAGATFAEVAVVLEEMGRAARRPVSRRASCSASGALELLEPNTERDELLARHRLGRADRGRGALG